MTDASAPDARLCPDTPAISQIITARPRPMDGMLVRRVLPTAARRALASFVFLDHIGSAEFAPGQGMDVRPHPHIHLATVTYLYEGEIFHRDSLGSAQAIRPGAVNWMTAGRGIVHSERTAPEVRRTGSRLHGLQLWVALPKAHEDAAPGFRHYPAEDVPTTTSGGASLRVIAGSAFGVTSPVETLADLLYVDAALPAGASVEVPLAPERGAYVVEGDVTCGAERATTGELLVFAPGANAVLRAETPARVAILGGAALDGPRYIEWNFVSSSKARIDEAKRDWRAGRFPSVPGDDREFIPLPEDP